MNARLLPVLIVVASAAVAARAQPACDAAWLAKAQDSSAVSSEGKDYVDAATGKIKFGGAVCPGSVWDSLKLTPQAWAAKSRAEQIEALTRAGGGSAARTPAATAAARQADERSRSGVAAAKARADALKDPFAARAAAPDAGTGTTNASAKSGTPGSGIQFSAPGSGTPGSAAYRARQEVPSPAELGAVVDKRLQSTVADDERTLRAYVASNIALLQTYEKKVRGSADADRLVASFRGTIQAAEDEYRAEIKAHEAATAKAYGVQDLTKLPHDALGFPLFKTADEAAIAASRLALVPTRESVKRRERREFGGLILKNVKTGQFTFTQYVRGGDHSIDLDKVPVPEGYVRAGSYHTHPHLLRAEDGGGASGEDIVNARNHHESAYVAESVIGAVYRYDGFDREHHPVGRQVAIASLGEQ